MWKKKNSNFRTQKHNDDYDGKRKTSDNQASWTQQHTALHEVKKKT